MFSRRHFLKKSSSGFGYLALSALLGDHLSRPQSLAKSTEHPLVPRATHFVPRAKRIIFVFMQGAISGMDTFDYKPELQKSDGKTGPGGGRLTASKFKFQQYGQTGSWFSELLPNIAQHADKFCWLRGLHTDTPAHPQAVVQLHTGSANASLTRPSMGAWFLYGLGSENLDLPGYITINPNPNFGGATNYGSAFLPAHFQGTRLSDTGYMSNLEPYHSLENQKKQLKLIQQFNRQYADQNGAPDPVEGVIASYELAFRMQDKVPDLLRIEDEPESVKEEYGIRPGVEGSFARQCLMARRLSEAGVRFVEITQAGWDHHQNLHQGLIQQTRRVDQPIAALLKDLDQRGLLDETLILFGSEFGRLPMSQGTDGRDHNITGYSMALAGAGVKAGYTHGGTDELGIKAVEGRMHVNDLHATLLALLGLDHERLTYPYGGRDFRLTDVAGKVATEIFS